jgi:hypothetical protein
VQNPIWDRVRQGGIREILIAQVRRELTREQRNPLIVPIVQQLEQNAPQDLQSP